MVSLHFLSFHSECMDSICKSRVYVIGSPVGYVNVLYNVFASIILAAPLVLRLHKKERGLSPPPKHGSAAQRTGPENISSMGSGLHEDQPVQLPASRNGKFSNVL